MTQRTEAVYRSARSTAYDTSQPCIRWYSLSCRGSGPHSRQTCHGSSKGAGEIFETYEAPCSCVGSVASSAVWKQVDAPLGK